MYGRNGCSPCNRKAMHNRRTGCTVLYRHSKAAVVRLYRTTPRYCAQSSTEASSLAQEVAGLQALEYEMSRNLDVLKQQQAGAKFSKTLAGRLFNSGGRLFAVYCVYRIFSVSVFWSGARRWVADGPWSRS